MAARTFSRAFGAIVRVERERRGLSQEQLAEKADLHRNHVGLIERAERSPSIDVAHRLARALGTPLATLITEAEKRYRHSAR